MKINNITNIAFQKTLRAKAHVLKDGQKYPVQIYQLDDMFDINEFYRAKSSKDWKKNNYIDNFISNFECFGFCPDEEYFSIENPDGDILCFSMISNNPHNKELVYFETAPKHSRFNKKRQYRYIGETMLAFLSHLCKKDKQDLWVSSIEDYEKTRDFYFSLCQMKMLNPDEAILKNKDLQGLIDRNESHTNSKIDFIG